MSNILNILIDKTEMQIIFNDINYGSVYVSAADGVKFYIKQFFYHKILKYSVKEIKIYSDRARGFIILNKNNSIKRIYFKSKKFI